MFNGSGILGVEAKLLDVFSALDLLCSKTCERVNCQASISTGREVSHPKSISCLLDSDIKAFYLEITSDCPAQMVFAPFFKEESCENVRTVY